jgi:hypothetical protein
MDTPHVLAQNELDAQKSPLQNIIHSEEIIVHDIDTGTGGWSQIFYEQMEQSGDGSSTYNSNVKAHNLWGVTVRQVITGCELKEQYRGDHLISYLPHLLHYIIKECHLTFRKEDVEPPISTATLELFLQTRLSVEERNAWLSQMGEVTTDNQLALSEWVTKIGKRAVSLQLPFSYFDGYDTAIKLHLLLQAKTGEKQIQEPIQHSFALERSLSKLIRMKKRIHPEVKTDGTKSETNETTEEWQMCTPEEVMSKCTFDIDTSTPGGTLILPPEIWAHYSLASQIEMTNLRMTPLTRPYRALVPIRIENNFTDSQLEVSVKIKGKFVIQAIYWMASNQSSKMLNFSTFSENPRWGDDPVESSSFGRGNGYAWKDIPSDHHTCISFRVRKMPLPTDPGIHMAAFAPRLCTTPDGSIDVASEGATLLFNLKPNLPDKYKAIVYVDCILLHEYRGGALGSHYEPVFEPVHDTDG